MPIEPYSASLLNDLAARSATTTPEARQDAIATNDARLTERTVEGRSENTRAPQAPADNAARPSQTSQPQVSDLARQVTLPERPDRRASSNTLTPTRQLAESVNQLQELLQQHSRQQLESSYRNPGTYFSVLV